MAAKKVLPRYPVYVPSKGRWENNLTAKFLTKDGVPFRLVVEPQEHKRYAEVWGADKLLRLPFSNRGLHTTRNWIKDHATKEGHERHWQLDDNIAKTWRYWKGKRIPCRSGIALRVTEDFVDRYSNVAIAGLNYECFGIPNFQPPFYLNVHVYSCTLILNSIPHRYRHRYNDDTDMCLQVLADGWCTVLMNAFLAGKRRTMTVQGGNTPIYQDDGRLQMARSLERVWPGVVETKRRFQRPQHVVKDQWRKFDTPLKFKPGYKPPKKANEYGMTLEQHKDEIRSEVIAGLQDEYNDRHAKGRR